MPRTIAVRPLLDGVDQRNSWKVDVNGARKSTHTIKSAAKRRARETARKSDLIQIYGTNGQHQESYHYEGSAGSKPTETAVWNVDDLQDDYDDLTDVF